MIKTKAYAMLGVTLLLVPLASSLIQHVKADSSWSRTWHDYFQWSGSPINVSSSTTIYHYNPNLDHWVNIGLVVSICEYGTYDVFDFVHFKVALYFDSFASEGLYPVPAETVTLHIDKDTYGSNLGDQAIEVVASSDVRPGFSQGGNLSQWGSKTTSDDPEDRAWWAAKALIFAVGLFCEPVEIVAGLIDLAYSFIPNTGTDYENAGWGASDISARCWWHCYGGDFGNANPVRQYAFNTIDWFQNWNIEPSSYYGIKVWASVGLPTNNPFGVSYIYTPDISLKIEPSGGGGGCPYVSVWNGSGFVLDNNLLPASEMSHGADVEDYYMLEQPLVPTHQGTLFSLYSLQIREFEHEHDFIDQVKLLAVDHKSDVDIAVTPDGEILTYSNPAPPISAVDNDGIDVLSQLNSIDENYYQGYNGSHITITFTSTDVSNGIKLVIRDDWPVFEKCPVYVQVLNATLQWNTVSVFYTRTYWATDIINLAGYLPDVEGNLKVRLCFVSNDKIDYVGLDTTSQADTTIIKTNAFSAIHSTQGSVTLKLLLNDQKYAELLPGEQIELKFILPNTQKTRTFIIYTEGHYETIS